MEVEPTGRISELQKGLPVSDLNDWGGGVGSAVHMEMRDTEGTGLWDGGR